MSKKIKYSHFDWPVTKISSWLVLLYILKGQTQQDLFFFLSVYGSKSSFRNDLKSTDGIAVPETMVTLKL